ncbi:Cys-tRNA(Pro) deacylase [Psychrosphaera aestuarii]|uniref:Cys-tRNA(Pro) deacylase n=1 Tax=Psychrosphaera aestuarii TaxID=1266052 RepID=UPI001B328637|nr:Cys-tRNA(Pro) deacylase [Psychrosphaera aestuarii]
MTPAINSLLQHNVKHKVHEYHHDSASPSYALEAAEKLSVDASAVYKTLIVKLQTSELIVALVPSNSKLNMKLVAKATGSKKATMADAIDAQRSSGYVLGGISPLGQKKRLRTFIDTSALNQSSIFISGGRRGLELELSATDLAKLCDATFTELVD